MNKEILFISIFFILISSCNKTGCTDIIALNYNDKATSDDGSCSYNIQYKSLNKEHIFITNVDELQNSNDPISNHIDSILSGDINSTVVSTGALYLDLDQNELTDFYFEIIDLNLFNINNLPISFDSLAVRAISSSVEFLDNSTWNYPDALNQNDLINSTSNWSSGPVVIGTFANAGQFNGMGEKYLGIRILEGNDYKYGWIRLKCSQRNDTLNIYDYAFNPNLNQEILANQK